MWAEGPSGCSKQRPVVDAEGKVSEWKHEVIIPQNSYKPLAACKEGNSGPRISFSVFDSLQWILLLWNFALAFWNLMSSEQKMSSVPCQVLQQKCAGCCSLTFLVKQMRHLRAISVHNTLGL